MVSHFTNQFLPIYSEWLPSSSTAPASARDSSRRYFFTSVLAFLHHYSLWLHVGVLVKHRLLGMTGGEGATLLPRYCAIPHDCFYSTVILREPCFWGDRRIPFSCTPYPTARERKGTTCQIPRGAMLDNRGWYSCITIPRNTTSAYSQNTACSE